MNEEATTVDLLGTPPLAPLPTLPLVEELSPALDPFQCLSRLSALPGCLFFDSAMSHPALGRYSFLTTDPFDWLQSRGSRVTLASRANVLEPANPFSVLSQQLQRYQMPTVAGLPPFQGGAAGLFSYDLCHHIERLPWPVHDEFAVPDMAVGFYDWVLAFDHVANRSWLISTGLPETDGSRRRVRAENRLRDVLKMLRSSTPAGRPRRFTSSPIVPAVRHPVPARPNLLSSFDREGYLQTVRRAIDYVHAGDCFQVNIAQRLLSPATLPPLDLYRRLRERNPAPFAGYFDLGDFVLASASPERFLRIDHGQIETRPIKGTRPRGQTPELDQKRIEELAASAKDRAENVMIVDLLRNDLGRVAAYGSINVEAVCRVETYQYVHHLVSVIRAQLRNGLGPVDALRAAFPGGSVTGAPKVRAMEIIAELEPVARGPYCGSLGYIGFDGSMDTSILIRTFTMGRGWVQFSVGGGIVADSVPAQEYEETWHKAEGMLRALK